MEEMIERTIDGMLAAWEPDRKEMKKPKENGKTITRSCREDPNSWVNQRKDLIMTSAKFITKYVPNAGTIQTSMKRNLVNVFHFDLPPPPATLE